MDEVKLAQKLIQFKTVTPNDDGILDFLSNYLSKTNFQSEIKYFGEDEKRTGNIYSKYGNSGRNFCFAGHVDVVPVGNESKWTFPPFDGIIEDGVLYGRGAVDMKGELACFIIAANEFIAENPSFSESISLLITGDEEDTGEFGLVKMLNYIVDVKKESFDACVIGEPTCDKMCDSVKIGRRGSVNFVLQCIGKQGHVAYPDLVTNPITAIAKAINALKGYEFDQGNEFYEPSNLEFVNVETDNFAKATNVVPSVANGMFNVRYNNIHTGDEVVKQVQSVLSKLDIEYKLSYRITNNSFLYGKNQIAQIAKSSILQNINNLDDVSFDCRGGTTDGRHIVKHCQNTVEVGLNEYMAHKIDECVKLDELNQLKAIYKDMLYGFFNS